MGNLGVPEVVPLWIRLDALYDAKQQEMVPLYIQPELFHYTTVEGLKGIIESNTLWATSAYHLNDSSEIEYGCKLVSDTINEWLIANHQQQPNGLTLPLLVLKHLRTFFEDPVSRVSRHVGIYVSCFCENGNLLSQWRAYGQAGGYSIGLLSSELELAMCAPGFFATRLLKVNYDRKQQYARIHSVLRDFIEVVEDQTLYTIPNERPALLEFLSQLETYLLELVMDEIVAFKNPAFEQEREWRIVARPRLIEMWRDWIEHDGTNNNRTQGTTATPVQYRHSRGVLVSARR